MSSSGRLKKIPAPGLNLEPKEGLGPDVRGVCPAPLAPIAQTWADPSLTMSKMIVLSWPGSQPETVPSSPEPNVIWRTLRAPVGAATQRFDSCRALTAAMVEPSPDRVTSK